METTTMLKKIPSALAGLAAIGGLLVSAPAHAIVYPPVFQWVPLGTGCASSIAVGANNVPWILGCGGGTNASPVGFVQAVFYLGQSCSGIACSPQWEFDNFDGMTLAVDLNGHPWATTANGVIYGDTGSTSSGKLLPSGQWISAGQGAVSAFVAGNFVNEYNSPIGEWFYPKETDNGPTGAIFEQDKFWGTGCGSNCKNGPFSTDAGIYSMEAYWSLGWTANWWSGWSQLPGAATRLALFTDAPISSTSQTGANTVQNIWVLTGEGTVFLWTGEDWQNVPAPEHIVSITDHYILGQSGMTYVWNGTSSGEGNATWSQALGQAVYTGQEGGTTTLMKQIAFSTAATGGFVGQSSPIGASEIWAIDYQGRIYSAQWTQVVIPE